MGVSSKTPGPHAHTDNGFYSVGKKIENRPVGEKLNLTLDVDRSDRDLKDAVKVQPGKTITQTSHPGGELADNIVGMEARKTSISRVDKLKPDDSMSI